MKIKEYIEYLKSLDQEKDIWVNYDCGYSVFEPYVRVADEDEGKIKKGDYYILAG